MAIRKDYKRLDYEPGQRKERTVLTPVERLKIVELKMRRVRLQKELDQLSDRALARRFDVSKSTIARIW